MIAELGIDAATDWARSGVVALTGRADGPPLLPPGVGASLAGQASRRLTEITADSGHTVHVDGAALLSERAAFGGFSRRGQTSSGGAARLLPTTDGWAAVSCPRPEDRQLLAALVGVDLPSDPWPYAAAWLREHTGSELAERAGLLGLAAAPVLPDRARPLPAGGRPRSPAGLLVVDFSALWAGPLCAHLLGLAGARVVKVETPQRPDGARYGNRDFYDLLHAGHRSVVLDPGTRGGRRALASLVAVADIVIEASRPRALAGFGLNAEAAVEHGTIWVSITAAGRRSPRVGFGDDVAASAGLVAFDDAGPVFCGDALADPLTGLVAAELALSEPSNGRGMLFDLSMSEVVGATLARPTDGDGGAHGNGTAVEARHNAGGWAVETPSGPVPVAAPRRRFPSGRSRAPGADTYEVLRELGIPSP